MKPRRRIILSRLVLFCSFPAFLSACTSGTGDSLGGFFAKDFVDIDNFGKLISKNITPVDIGDSLFQKKLLQDLDLNVSYAYHLSGNKPLWFDAGGAKKGTGELVAKLSELWTEGLNPQAYKVDYIQNVLHHLENAKGATFSVDSIVHWDKVFTTAYLSAAKDLQMGSGNIRVGDSLWFAKNDSLFSGADFLVRSLMAEPVFPSLDTFRSTLADYYQMKKAMKDWNFLRQDSIYLSRKRMIVLGQQDSLLYGIISRELGSVVAKDDLSQGIATYQYYHQLKITGKHDSATYNSLKQMPDDYIRILQINMDRLRALPRQAGSEFVWANIPLMEVDYYRNNTVKFHGRIVVGKRARQTPSLWAPMANVVFNPPWGVPPTILKNDVGPGVSRSGSGYLARKGLRAFNAKGQDVTASVNGENYRRFSYRQPPGARNALGEVKFNLPNKWDIYLHDTPHRENFASRNRALSSGCVRVQNPKLLAEAILVDRNYTPERIDSVIQTRRTKYEQLKRNLPVYIVYVTVASDSTGSALRYLEDVYGRDKKMSKSYTVAQVFNPKYKD